MFFFFFFFNDTATTEIYTLSLHDALPISGRAGESGQAVSLVSGEDRTLLRDIERLIGKKIEQQVIPGYEPGSGYHSAQPEPQGRRGQQRQNQPRNSGGQRNAQRNQGNAQRNQGNGQRRPVGPMRGPQSPSQPRQGQQPRRDHGHRQEPRATLPALPSEKVQQSVRQEQLEYHRHQQQAEQHRSEPAPAKTPERSKDKAVPALFGVVGRKVA